MAARKKASGKGGSGGPRSGTGKGGTSKGGRKKGASRSGGSKSAGAKKARGSTGRGAKATGGRRTQAVARARRPSAVARKRSRQIWLRRLRRTGRVAAIVAFALGLWWAGWLIKLDRTVVQRFEGRRFEVPSKVYAAPLVLYPGSDWERADLPGWLSRLGYRDKPNRGVLEPGRYRWNHDTLRVHMRAFDHPLRPEPARELAFTTDGGVIQEIVDLKDGSAVNVVVLEPEPVSAFLGDEREQRDLVTLEELPRHLVNAIYAVEDRRFEQHHGIDPRRIVGAMLANVRAGRITQGGSTLTQQLVKNFFLTPERTLSRKAQEAMMALIVEARYDKAAILQAYLNEIYLGQRGSTAVHGVGEAARLYFGKEARDLTLAESALIAAIIQSPNGISPHRRPERAVKRRNLVLSLMHDQGMVDADQLDEARAEVLRVSAVTPEAGEVRYFLSALSQQLPEVYDERTLSSDGLRIYATLDPRLQRAAARALKQGIARIEGDVADDVAPDKRLQGCLLAMRPQTGEILALVGGRSFGVSQFNRCTQARRQVGSAFKPIVYVTALDPSSGPLITLASRIDDSPLEIETREGLWQPQNYDLKFNGEVSVREALERSLNVASARLADEVGIARVAAMARRLGVTSRLPEVASLALGTAELSPLEVARVYATLANGGRRPVPRTFVDVVKASGAAVEHQPLEGSTPVIDPGVAFLATSLLEGVVDRGTAVRVRSAGLVGPIAGKTGTTDDEYDLWFVGYTPELVAVVWLGYDEPRAVGVPSSRGALPIWTDFVREAIGSNVRGAFPKPGNIESAEIEPTSGALALRGCREQQPEFFLAGTLPIETCPAGATPPTGQPGLLRRTFGRLFGGGR